MRKRRLSPWTDLSFDLLTSELRDERHHAVLLEDVLQLGLHVVVHVGLKGVLEQDSPSGQDVMQEVGHVEHRPSCT